jgi:hypothetical protein
MTSSLSPELTALCEAASHEQDPKKLLELAKRINDALELAEPGKQKSTQPAPSSANSTAA